MKKIFAYMYDRRGSFDEVCYEGIDYINYSFGLIDNGVLSIKHLEHFEDIINMERSFGIILSIGGWGADGFSDAVLTKESRELFINSIIEVVKKYNLDGIDLDWEYPGISGAGTKCREEDTPNFTAFVKGLREGLDSVKPGLLLTAAVGAGHRCADKLELKELAKYFDHLNIMTYDMNWPNNVPFSHHTNLFASEKSSESADDAIKYYAKSGFPIEKMVIGCAFYGKAVQINKDDKGHGYPYKKIVKLEGYTYFWDEKAQAPIMYNDKEAITYDDVNSVNAKCDYLLKNNMAGIMFWELFGDNGDLVKAMVKKIK